MVSPALLSLPARPLEEKRQRTEAVEEYRLYLREEAA
jgi:hypothetical protein